MSISHLSIFDRLKKIFFASPTLWTPKKSPRKETVSFEVQRIKNSPEFMKGALYYSLSTHVLYQVSNE